jgi:hypothetical protein
VADLTLCSDPRPAGWLVGSGTPFEQLVLFGPDVFAASARVLLIPDPTRPGMDETDAVVADDHPPELVQVQRAVRRLAGFTGTPDDAYVCVWEGCSDVPMPAGLSPGSMVVLPHRR